MAVTTIQITQTGSAVQVSASQIFAKWIVFQNNGAAGMRVGDANVSSSRGMALAASGAANSQLILAPLADTSAHYDLSQFYTQGTNTQILDVVYDRMN